MKIFISLLFLITTVNLTSHAQPDEKINKYLDMTTSGQIEEVKMELLDLLAEYPDHPGVMLLHGIVLDEASRSYKIFKRITQKHPESKWAENAYWRMVLYHAVKGDTSEAMIMLKKFKQKYPGSDFIKSAAATVNMSLSLARSGEMSVSASEEKKSSQEQMIDYMESKKKQESAKKAGSTEKMEDVEPVQVTKTESSESEEAGNMYRVVPPRDKSKMQDAWGLQVGIFSSKDAAEEEMHKFLKQRMRCEVIEKEVDNEALYAVVIGNYTSKESAEAAKEIVKQQCNCNPIVFKKK